MDGAELVAKTRRKLKLHVLRRRAHALHQPGFEFVGLAFEEELGVLDDGAVVSLRDQPLDARPSAALDVVLQAGPRVVALKVDLAAGDQEAFAHDVGKPMGEIAGKVGAKVGGAVLAQAASDEDLRMTVA